MDDEWLFDELNDAAPASPCSDSACMPMAGIESASDHNTTLVHLQNQISALKEQNLVLVKNISKLFLTAKKELAYKNDVIRQLRADLAIYQPAESGPLQEQPRQHPTQNRSAAHHSRPTSSLGHCGNGGGSRGRGDRVGYTANYSRSSSNSVGSNHADLQQRPMKEYQQATNENQRENRNRRVRVSPY